MSTPGTEMFHKVKESMDAPMKALQILQTIMLFALVGIGAWTTTTTVESARTISSMEQEFKALAKDNSRVADELTRLSEAHNMLDRRVTIIETKVIR